MTFRWVGEQNPGIEIEILEVFPLDFDARKKFIEKKMNITGVEKHNISRK